MWRELRKLRYLRVQGKWSFRNYWFGEDMPLLRRFSVARWAVDGFYPELKGRF
jgi:hypothetical protein